MPITPRSSCHCLSVSDFQTGPHVDVALLDFPVITGLIIVSACSSKQCISVRNYLKEQELFHCLRGRASVRLIGQVKHNQCSGSGTLRSLQAPSMHTLHLVVATPTRRERHICMTVQVKKRLMQSCSRWSVRWHARSAKYYNCKNLAFFTVLPPLRAMIIFWLSSRSELLHKNNGFMQTRKATNEFNMTSSGEFGLLIITSHGISFAAQAIIITSTNYWENAH